MSCSGSTLRRATARALAGTVAIFAGYQLAWPPVRDFAPARPFEGPLWYSPLQDAAGAALRANFHAHSRTWAGLTFGEGSSAELREHYRGLGYGVIGISNYQSIEPRSPSQHDPLYIPTYEHGLSRVHQTVIGASRVSWFDYPIWQGARHQQDVIDRLRAEAPVVILNHPGRHRAYSADDLARLSGYTALEVASKYGTWLDLWDAALSAGRPVWGVASDDGHRVVARASHSGIGWLELAPREDTTAGVLEALRSGRFYSVRNREKQPAPRLLESRIDDGVLLVRCAQPVDSIRFIGQSGVLRSELSGRAEARYRLRDDDSYVRVEIVQGTVKLLLNPVFRYTRDPLAMPAANALLGRTWAVRALALALVLAVLWLVWRLSAQRSEGGTASAAASLRNNA